MIAEYLAVRHVPAELASTLFSRFQTWEEPGSGFTQVQYVRPVQSGLSHTFCYYGNTVKETGTLPNKIFLPFFFTLYSRVHGRQIRPSEPASEQSRHAAMGYITLD